jgi:hypothetical protein
VLSLSIIVPCGGAEPFEDTLVSILQNRPAGSEVTVVTAGDYDDPYDLADELDLVAAPPTAGLAEQINLGVRASHGDVIHIVQRGLAVEEGWVEPAFSHFESEAVGAVAPAIRGISRSAVLAGVRSGRRSRRLEVLSETGDSGETPAFDCQGPSLLAGFWRRSAWERAGGLDVNLGLPYADLDLAITLQALGYECAAEPRSRITDNFPRAESAASWSEGRSAELLFWKHAGTSRGAYLLNVLGLTREFATALPRPGRILECLGRLSILPAVMFGGARSRPAAGLSQPSSGRGGEPLRRRDNLLPEREILSAPRKAVQTY